LIFVGAGACLIALATFVALWKSAQPEYVVPTDLPFGLPANPRSRPGVAELVASGCDSALVMDAREDPLLGTDDGPYAGPAPLAVVCEIQPGHPTRSCDDVAATYVKTVPVAEPFTAGVSDPDGNAVACVGFYGVTGKLLRALPIPSARRIAKPPASASPTER
jgi:hypothetical protein